MKSHVSVATRAALNVRKKNLKVHETDFNVELKKDDSPLTLADNKTNLMNNSFFARSIAQVA